MAHGPGMARILRRGCVCEVAKVVVETATIKVVDLPVFHSWRGATECKSDQPMDIKVSPINLRYSVSRRLQGAITDATVWRQNATKRANMPCASSCASHHGIAEVTA